MQKKKEKILFVSGREVNYPRNNQIINALKKSFNVKTIGPHKKKVARGNYLSIFFNSILGSLKSIINLLRTNYTFLVIGFYGQFIMLFLSKLSRKPKIFDFFISTWDTLVNDRRRIKRNSFLEKFVFNIDKKSCSYADLILVDTQSSLEYFHAQFGIPKEKMRVLYVGCNEDLFYPRESQIDENLVLYYSSYMPLHGVDVIVRSAKLLENKTNLHFLIVGDGQESQKIKKLVDEMDISNIEFMPTIPLDELPEMIAKASICLGGHFGASEKASRVIPGKIFQLLAMAKPVIVGDNEANRELLAHGKDAWFCEMNNPEDLAEAILYLHENELERERIGRQGLATFKEKASLATLSKQLVSYITELETSRLITK